jgi:2-oxoglutarate ferredoxin oxidoreductase subunit beta
MKGACVFGRPAALNRAVMHYCPGCGHGIAHRLVAEALDHFGVTGRTLAVAPVGCAVMLYDYFNVDVIEAPHGRAPAIATGMKRAAPDQVVFAYQGDGDLAAIGLSEIVHAANRGENITVVFVNNTVYGMTGGQMAPTTMPGQQTTTSPYGRDPRTEGYPLKMAEMIGALDAVAYSARMALDTPANVLRARKAVFRAFEVQVKEKGFGFVELLSTCPTNWGMSPRDSQKRITDELIPHFPLGIFKQTLDRA